MSATITDYYLLGSHTAYHYELSLNISKHYFLFVFTNASKKPTSPGGTVFLFANQPYGCGSKSSFLQRRSTWWCYRKLFRLRAEKKVGRAAPHLLSVSVHQKMRLSRRTTDKSRKFPCHVRLRNVSLCRHRFRSLNKSKIWTIFEWSTSSDFDNFFKTY